MVLNLERHTHTRICTYIHVQHLILVDRQSSGSAVTDRDPVSYQDVALVLVVIERPVVDHVAGSRPGVG